MSAARHVRWVPEVPEAYAEALEKMMAEGGLGAAGRDDATRGRVAPTIARETAARAPGRADAAYGVAGHGRAARRGGGSYEGDVLVRGRVPLSRDARRDVAPAPDAWERRPVRRGLAPAARLLALVAVALRIAATLLCALVVANAVARGFMRLPVLDVTTRVTSVLPRGISGVLVVRSPLGGSFRGDLALSAIILFVCDWLCVRVAAAASRR